MISSQGPQGHDIPDLVDAILSNLSITHFLDIFIYIFFFEGFRKHADAGDSHAGIPRFFGGFLDMFYPPR